MTDLPLLNNIVIILCITVFVLWLCNLLRIPTLVGLLFTGVLCGPHGLKLVHNVNDVDALAKIGIMLLLFTIGVEFSLKRLLQVKRFFFIGGMLQVCLTVLIGFLIGQFLQRPLGESLFLGFLLSMSSTAIVVKGLEAEDASDTLYGRISMGILIFQDIIAIPMMLLLPILGDQTQPFDTMFLVRLLIGIGVIACVFVAALKIVPTILFQVARVRSRELFLLSSLTICFAVAWLASSIGLSLALGAFLAGLIISESEYSHETIGNVLPLQDIFASLFFVSIGMILDMEFVFEHPLLITLIAIGIMLMKWMVVAFTCFCLGMPLKIMILTGLALCQIGEFSFVLARAGLDYKLGLEFYYQLFLAVSLMTMALTPFCIKSSQWIANQFLRLPFSDYWRHGVQDPKVLESKLHDHIIIVGFGIVGRRLAHAAKVANLPYVVLEINPETVKAEQLKGEPIYFGDATHETVLHHVNIQSARAISIVINDSKAIRHIIPLVRKLNPNAYLIVRTRYLHDVEHMKSLGASDVIPDEIGTSLEIFSRVLQRYHISDENIESMINRLRSDSVKYSY